MPLQAMDSYIPLDVPTPAVSDTEVFSDLQWKTLLSLADTVVPSIRTKEAARPADKVVSASELNGAISKLASRISGPDSVQIATKYMDENASSNPQFRVAIQRLFSTYVPTEGKNGLSLILNVLKYVRHVLDSRWAGQLTQFNLQHTRRISGYHWVHHSDSGPTFWGSGAAFC